MQFVFSVSLCDIFNHFPRIERVIGLFLPLQNIVSEREQGSTSIKEGQVAMDFTGERGRVITDSKEIQELANTRNKAVSTERYT